MRLPWYNNNVDFAMDYDLPSGVTVVTGTVTISNFVYMANEGLTTEALEDEANIDGLLASVIGKIMSSLEVLVATTPEGKVKKKVKEALNELGCYYFSPRGGPYAQNGVPDIIVCHNSRFIGIECKAGKGKPTVLQEKNLADIAKSGGLALIINEENVHMLKYKIEYFLENL